MIYFKMSLEMSESLRKEFEQVMSASKSLLHRHQVPYKNQGIHHELDILFMTPHDSYPKLQPAEYHRNLIRRVVRIIHPDVPLAGFPATMFRVPPHGQVPAHVDNPEYGRRTGIVFPITPYDPDKWAPCKAGMPEPDTYCEFHPCYAFSTDARHEVYNNEYERSMVQIWVDLDCSEVYDRYKSGKLFVKSLNSNDFFFRSAP